MDHEIPDCIESKYERLLDALSPTTVRAIRDDIANIIALIDKDMGNPEPLLDIDDDLRLKLRSLGA